MGFGGGGGQTQSQSTSGSGSSQSMQGAGGNTWNQPVLYNWREILPPWVASSQAKTLPWLMNRAATGLTPQEERGLWGQARESIEGGSNLAQKGLARQLAGSGLSPSSPMAAGAFADLATDKMSTTSKAALDFAKMKMGAKDTAIGQMLTAMYSPSPVAVGQEGGSSYGSTGWSTSAQQSSGGGSTSSGGGK